MLKYSNYDIFKLIQEDIFLSLIVYNPHAVLISKIVMYQDSFIGDSLVHEVLLCEKVYLYVALKGSYIIGFRWGTTEVYINITSDQSYIQKYYSVLYSFYYYNKVELD